MSYLDEKSARELIVQPVEDFTDIYDCAKRSAKGDRTAIDAIIHLTRSQPYLVKLTCQEVIHSLNSGGTRLDLLHAFDQDYQIHLCKSLVHLWLKILASALWQEV
ncbi:MAG: hypothetical protein ICV63_20420 [Coleofasciculus sp. Co-bin14]|nr:hypothetical protein [Coleofasciculus sp. Co-bin14]